MKTYFLLAVLCSMSCSRVEHQTATDTTTEQGHTTLTLDNLSRVEHQTATDTTTEQGHTTLSLGNLLHVDAMSEGISHPLVCGVGRDYPDGHELIFRSLESEELVHSVFSKENLPQNLDGKYILYGHYQTIQNREIYTHMQPPKDYRYFVASSWEQQK